MSPPDRHVVRALVDLAVFLEFTDFGLNEDAAVSAIEQLASELKLLDACARLDLSKQIADLSESYADAAVRAFVAKLPESLGLAG